MAVTFKDYSRLNEGTATPDTALIFSQMHAEVARWLAVVNAQNPEQPLSVIAAPGDCASPCGWTIKARLGVTYPLDHATESLRGQPVELIHSVVFSGTNTLKVGRVAAHEWSSGADPHGVMTRATRVLWGWAYPNRMPLVLTVCASTDPGAEFLLVGVANSTHNYQTATVSAVVPLLIAKDQVSGLWLLANVQHHYSPYGVSGLHWNRRAGRLIELNGINQRGASTSGEVKLRALARIALRPATARPSAAATLPIQHLDSCLLPEAVRSARVQPLSWINAPDGSGWFAVAPDLLVRLREATQQL